MKKYMICILFALSSIKCIAQIYIDPTTAAATAAHSGIMNQQLDKSAEQLTLIQKAQLSLNGQLAIANSLQENIYKGLSEVSAIMNNLLAVKDITEIAEDIIVDANRALKLAGSNPALLLFAESGAREFKVRSVKLAGEVGSFVLKGGREHLMDSGERAKLLNRIVTEMNILRGVSYGMYRMMYRAKLTGLLQSLNPYSSYINIDKRLADEILSKSKTLRQ